MSYISTGQDSRDSTVQYCVLCTLLRICHARYLVSLPTVVSRYPRRTQEYLPPGSPSPRFWQCVAQILCSSSYIHGDFVLALPCNLPGQSNDRCPGQKLLKRMLCQMHARLLDCFSLFYSSSYSSGPSPLLPFGPPSSAGREGETVAASEQLPSCPED